MKLCGGDSGGSLLAGTEVDVEEAFVVEEGNGVEVAE